MSKTSNDILAERVAKAKDLLKVIPSEDLKIATFFFQFALILEEAYNQQKKSLSDHLKAGALTSDGESVLCGFPGTQQNALDTLSEQFNQMNNAFHNMSQTIKEKSVELQKYPSPQQIKDQEKTLNDALSPANDLNLLKSVIPQTLSSAKKEYTKSLTKLNDLVSSLAKKSSTSDKQKKQVLELYTVIEEARKSVDVQRNALILKANNAMKSFEDHLLSFSRFSQSRNDLFKELFDIAMFAYMKVCGVLQNSGGLVEDAGNQIDFTADMSAYAKVRGIVRYDLQVKPFEEFSSPTPAFQNIDYRVRLVRQYFDPIGFAKVTHSFRAENPNELNAIRGKRVLILERPGGDWTFVMHPVTRTTGFVPTQCIEQIGVALGVVLRKARPGEVDEQIMIRPGEYVAVMDLQTLAFETLRGEKCSKVPQNLIGIVYQNY